MMEKPKVPLWRNPTVRARFYQLTLLAGLITLAVNVYQNTLDNLAQRGIGSGFGFLANEAGFRIGEVSTLPVFKGGFLWFIAALFFGLVASQILASWLKQRHENIGDKDRWILATIALTVVVPLLTLYLGRDTVETVQYTESSSYTLALMTGFANTIKVTIIGCILSTILGLFVALGRLSPNWLISKLCKWYVEVNRNLPVLMQLFFWYFIVIQQLPNVRQSINIGDWLFLNKRGLYIPSFIPQDSALAFCVAVAVALFSLIFIWRRSKRVLEATGEPGKVLFPSLTVLIVLPGLVWLFGGTPFVLEMPALRGFNFKGGTGLTPEFTALVVGLTVYVSAFNAEIIRSGIQSVSKGQREAARALGLKERHVMRLVILPQAMRVIMPPMTSEYLAIAKSSSLAVAVGYPELVSVGGTILNQSGQSVEIVGVWMAVYLSISLLISAGMNWYNARIKLVER